MKCWFETAKRFLETILSGLIIANVSFTIAGNSALRKQEAFHFSCTSHCILYLEVNHFLDSETGYHLKFLDSVRKVWSFIITSCVASKFIILIIKYSLVFRLTFNSYSSYSLHNLSYIVEKKGLSYCRQVYKSGRS